ncbi:MAG: hypothetical protein K9G44_03405 [Melioribacteraceae bacterium]|nr:hypothetical protein [Melioribacteraceae bacterium]
MPYKRNNLFNFIALILFVLISTIFSGCEDDPVEPQSEHYEAIGVYLSQSGIKVASILRGETTDTLFVAAGARTDGINVQFYDENEELIEPPTESGTSFAWEIENPTLVSVWQHEGEEGGFEFHLDGIQEGITSIELFIMHNDHPDFRSGEIPVKVSGN